ncbi:MAG: PIN domain-containing protein [Planctomycetaceae bacterium]|jgi:predicted nucleic acid-binding protein|nr:PIN domain-containing protein [Planctomycetaceae bacterium]
MKRALFDTNVILDLVLNRPDFVEFAKQLFIAIDENRLTGYMSATTVTDIYYVTTRERGREFAALSLRRLVRVLEIVAVDKNVIVPALDSPIKDFEDAVQAEAAKSIGLDFIVTRNKRDFPHSPVLAVSPEELLKKLK